MPLKDKCNILCAVFGIKQGEARKYVYDKFTEVWLFSMIMKENI